MHAIPLESPHLKAKEYSPDYRVEFWHEGGAAAGVWRLNGAIDVLQAVGWAVDQDIGATFAIYVEAPVAGGVAALRIYDGAH